MPDAPSTSLISRWILENPWPLGGLLILAALLIGWLALRDGISSRLKLAGALAAAGLAIFTLAFIITTPAEHAKATVRQLVTAAEAADITGAKALFSDRAMMSFGSADGPGMEMADIARRLDLLATSYRITSNQVLSLKGFTENDDTGIVHLACLTDVESGYGATPSTWFIRVKRQPDGQWRITRLSMISIANRPATDVFR